MGPVRCRRCGTAADTDEPGVVPLGWSTTTREGGVDALCDRCTRAHVRDIEGKLDDEWWG